MTESISGDSSLELTAETILEDLILPRVRTANNSKKTSVSLSGYTGAYFGTEGTSPYSVIFSHSELHVGLQEKLSELGVKVEFSEPVNVSLSKEHSADWLISPTFSHSLKLSWESPLEI